MAKFKDFGAGPAISDYEPISFRLYGEEFNCIPAVQGSVILDLVSASADEAGAASAEMITGFFQSVLEDESLERFNALIHSKDKIVSIEQLGEITGWLVEEYTNRPEEQPGA